MADLEDKQQAWSSAATLGERLKEIRELEGFTLADFAEALGTHPNTLRNYEGDKRVPDGDFFTRLRAATKRPVNLNWLLGSEKQPFDDNVELPVPGDPDLVYVPRYELSASAGAGVAVSEENVVDYLAFRSSWVRSHIGVASSNLALISVSGDSMEPTLIKGDLVLIDTSATTVNEDGIYVLCDGDVLVVKRLQRFLGGRIVVRSDNRAYEDYDLTPEMESVRIVGRVRWFGREL